MRLCEGWSVPIVLFALLPPLGGCGDDWRLPGPPDDPIVEGDDDDDGDDVTPAEVDAAGGGETIDAGAPDGGGATPDAGTATPDADTATPDAGTATPDAGAPAPDAGAPAPDATDTTTCGGAGYWKNHPAGWPVASLTLGTVLYDQQQLIAILEAPTVSNGIESLAQQLIAAKLNIAAGVPYDASVAQAIADADALIGGLVIPPVGAGYLEPSLTDALIQALDDFNRSVPSEC